LGQINPFACFTSILILSSCQRLGISTGLLFSRFQIIIFSTFRFAPYMLLDLPIVFSIIWSKQHYEQFK